MSGFEGWYRVAEALDTLAVKAARVDDRDPLLDEGQCTSIRVIAERLRDGRRALLVADEVGMGKTRIAVALISAVRKCGGRAAIVMPAGLGAQWQSELRLFNPDDRTLLPLRSYESFIRGFGSEGEDGLTRRRDAQLRDRRLQRELPEHSWQTEKILMISHAFARMAFPVPKNGEHPWRRELMPALEALLNERRRNMRDGGRAERCASHRAARAAFDTLATHPLRIERAPVWRQVSSDDYRSAALPVIGRALGCFDLIVIDEAHKARGEDSSLSRILGSLIWEGEDAFRLGMTATPVELDPDQWCNTLKRICGSDSASVKREGNGNDLDGMKEHISAYAKTANRLMTEPLDETRVAEFELVAKRFSSALAPYVIRRDKRSDEELTAFRAKNGLQYRHVQKVLVEPAHMGRDWMRAFCAAEALSLLPQTDRTAKRHRLMLEKGHGLDKLILETAAGPSAGALDFWSRKVLLPKGVSIFEHPAILAAMKTIEAATAEGRKVLVFGTLIEPLQALTHLLDARAMLRHLADGKHWPTSGVSDKLEPALRTALHQPDCPRGVPDGVEGASDLLNKRYTAARRNREASLRAVHREIMARAQDGDDTASLIAQVWQSGTHEEGEVKGQVTLLLEALESRLPRRSEARDAGEPTDWTADLLLEETRILMSELSQGAGDTFAEEKPITSGAQNENPHRLLQAHLTEYSGRDGSFARLLYGKTKPQTRRLLQAAFNREGSWPMVLVAQSMVGREGLNLHEDCRTVVILHAEWNPAVVEQQIGRVDRKNSRFLKDYRAGVWRQTGAPPPRIEIYCIQMDGGYDSLHWADLEKRWASLRAQLHGDIVSVQDRERARTDPELASLIRRLDLAAPDFHPKLSVDPATGKTSTDRRSRNRPG